MCSDVTANHVETGPKKLATKGTKEHKVFVPSVAHFPFPVEMIGFEPTASAVQVRRSPN